ncbi:MAG: aminomethyl-transferring glycine dehydrogenase subunit GcvPA [Nitrospinae bacterium]|nr:aminomethyl-transferring glycine dehydrogenase subunit GcvPA [Nitrospinota bacterium]
MRYIPNTDKDRKEMLASIGVKSVEEFFTYIPEALRQKASLLNLPPSMTEPDILRHIREMGGRNADTESHISFLGAGAYSHYIPSVVDHIISRSEFYTAYTPYQPEISQGTLQAVYEFQTLICQLTGMEAANASMYDGASALAEAVLMAHRINGRKDVLISGNIHPEYRQVVNTYCRYLDINIKEIPFTEKGITDLEWLSKNISEETSAIAAQNPNFFGCIENIKVLGELAHAKGSLFIACVNEPVSLGILNPPGDFGADIVAGEGQGLGNPLSFGGPYLGLFAAREKYIRSMPGRLVGRTVDADGKTGYVLTLSTREQHIRREKATSNICSNQALCALSAAVYMSLMGKDGFKKLAILNLQKADYAKGLISGIEGYKLKFHNPVFNEFVIETPVNPDDINKELIKEGIIGGLPLEKFYPELKNCMLLSVTENHRKEDIEKLWKLLRQY